MIFSRASTYVDVAALVVEETGTGFVNELDLLK